MSVDAIVDPRPLPTTADRPTGSAMSGPLVIATALFWRYWAAVVKIDAGPQSNVLIGCGGNPHWSGEKRFALTDEARPIVKIIEAWNGPAQPR